MMASGKWSALLYRADIEMNLRTPEWGGFQLLDLQDYPDRAQLMSESWMLLWKVKG